MNHYQQQVVMITGASRGLGRALTLAFAGKGARLALCARTEQAVHRVKEEAESLGAAEVLIAAADASVAADIDQFVTAAEVRFGQIDVLINNAAILGPSPMPLLLDYPDEAFLETIRVNTMGPFLVTKRVLPGMLRRGQGSIIHVSSEAGKTGFAGWGAYGVSKFALEGLAQTWANELKDTPVRMNWVDPGSMATDMMAQADPNPSYSLADPQHVADVFLYLASPEAKDFHGQRFVAEDFVR